MTSFDAEKEAQSLIDFMTDYNSKYATQEMFLLFGMDFNYINAF